MPLPLSRPFPKIKTASDDASLIISADAIAVFHPPTADLQARRAPKQLPILAEREFKFILKTNHSNLPISLLTDHLKQILNSRAGSLGISSMEVIQDCILLVTTKESSSSLPSCSLPHAILDHIVLDYRFKMPKLTELYDGSQSQEPLLPLKELLDPALQKLICLHMIRQLPLVFGGWNDVLEDDAFLSKRIGRAIRRIVARSKNAEFRRHIQESTSTLNHSLTKLHDHLLEQLVDKDETLAEEVPLPENTENVITRSLLVTSQSHFRPKPLKRKINTQSFDMPEESQPTSADDPEVSERNVEILLELDMTDSLVPGGGLFSDGTDQFIAEYDDFYETGPHTLDLDDQNLESGILEIIDGEDEDSDQTNIDFITDCFDEDEGTDYTYPFETADRGQPSGLEQQNADDDMLFN